MRAEASEGSVTVCVSARLCDVEHRPAEGGACTLLYTLTEDGLRVEGTVPEAADARYVLPSLSAQARVEVLRGACSGEPEPVFCLSPGFAGREYVVLPDGAGRFAVRVSL